MADHNLPTVASTYTNVLAQIDARLDDIALGLNSVYVTATNLPVNSIRWNASSLYWEKYNGTTWAALSSAYNININGTVGATNTSTGAFTTLSTSGVAALAASSTVGGSLIVTAGGAYTFTGTQTFNNTIPIISGKIGPTSAYQHTLPSTTSDTVALLAASQTFTNKTYSAGALSGTFSGNVTLSGQVSFTDATAGIIVTTIGGNATQRHTIPLIASDTIALLAATQTLTNKTLGSGTVYNGGTIAINYGGTGGTTVITARAALGIDAIGDARPASDVYAWAKTPGKPAYAFNEINSGAINATTISGNSISVSGDIAGSTGSFSSNVTVGSGLSGSQLNMGDTDEGIRVLHCNSNRIGFLTQAGAWGSYCNDDGSWTSDMNITAYSDIKLKENIVTIDLALDKVLKLRGVYYTRKDRENGVRKVGVIAQEIQEVLPEVVISGYDKVTDNTTLSVDYGNITALLIEAIKDLNIKITKLQNK